MNDTVCIRRKVSQCDGRSIEYDGRFFVRHGEHDRGSISVGDRAAIRYCCHAYRVIISLRQRGCGQQIGRLRCRIALAEDVVGIDHLNIVLSSVRHFIPAYGSILQGDIPTVGILIHVVDGDDRRIDLRNIRQLCIDGELKCLADGVLHSAVDRDSIDIKSINGICIHEVRFYAVCLVRSVAGDTNLSGLIPDLDVIACQVTLGIPAERDETARLNIIHCVLKPGILSDGGIDFGYFAYDLLLFLWLFRTAEGKGGCGHVRCASVGRVSGNGDGIHTVQYERGDREAGDGEVGHLIKIYGTAPVRYLHIVVDDLTVCKPSEALHSAQR